MLIMGYPKEAISVWANTEVEKHILPQIALNEHQAEIVAGFNGLYKDVLINFTRLNHFTFP
jgi:hypothetical protein